MKEPIDFTAPYFTEYDEFRRRTDFQNDGGLRRLTIKTKKKRKCRNWEKPFYGDVPLSSLDVTLRNVQPEDLEYIIARLREELEQVRAENYRGYEQFKEVVARQLVQDEERRAARIAESAAATDGKPADVPETEEEAPLPY